MLHNPSGTISSGEMLGVRVGDSWAEADAKLRTRFKPNTVLWQTGRMENEGGSGVQLGRVAVLIGEAEVSYDDDSWRNGWVTLELKDGVVTRISWGYCPFCIVF